MYWVYILECSDGSLYTGITTDVQKRFAQHQNGTGAKYTKSHAPIRIAYKKKYADRSKAQKREAEIKSWPREQKLFLINQ